jgi:PPOX class probable FMN-dependent enzyme
MSSRIDCLRETLGGPHPLAAKKVKPFLEPYVRAFIEHAPFAVMASSNANGDCDASPKGGRPGFVKVIDDRTLLIPDVGGNRLFQSYQNFESNPKAGFLFMIPGMDVTVRVNGRVSVVEPDDLARRGVVPEIRNPDGNSNLVQGLLLEIDEAYFHCPRSFQFAELWNSETIEANRKRSLKDLKENGAKAETS